MNSTSVSSTIEQAVKAMRSLRPGESYVYYQGFLEGERLYMPNGVHSQIADAAYTLMQEGHVTLVQRRINEPRNRLGKTDWVGGSGDGFEYVAIGIKPKTPKQNITYAKILREGWR